MFVRLLILFITVPLLELLIFLTLGTRIGIPATVAIVIVTGFLGAWLTKSQGLKTLSRYQESMQSGKIPHREILDGLLILIAGAVLLTPGFLTDALGFSLLVPPFREKVRGWISGYLKGRIQVVGESVGAPPGSANSSPETISVESEVIEDFVVVDSDDQKMDR